MDGDGEIERKEVLQVTALPVQLPFCWVLFSQTAPLLATLQMMDELGFNLSKKGMESLVDDLFLEYDTDGNGVACTNDVSVKSHGTGCSVLPHSAAFPHVSFARRRVGTVHTRDREMTRIAGSPPQG